MSTTKLKSMGYHTVRCLKCGKVWLAEFAEIATSTLSEPVYTLECNEDEKCPACGSSDFEIID